jgi:hypothetical protein
LNRSVITSHLTSFRLDGSQVVRVRSKGVSLQEIVLVIRAQIRGTSSPWLDVLKVAFVCLPENTLKMPFVAVR